MTPAPRLNTAHAHTWAAVVSGTAWKRHTLAPDGLLTAEYARGPLILWAIPPGEGEAVSFTWSKTFAYHACAARVKAKSFGRRMDFIPEARIRWFGGDIGADEIYGMCASPTQLEEYIERLNTAPVFERFRWAARGRVRPSVRWKTGRRPRRFRKLETLAWLGAQSLIADIWAAADGRAKRRDICGKPASRTAKGKREAQRAAVQAHRADRLRAMAPANWQDNPDGIDLDRLEWWNFWGVVLCNTYSKSRCKPYPPGFGMPESRSGEAIQPDMAMAAFFALMGKTQELSALLAHLRTRRHTLGEILKAFELAEYRAHLTRRVKPVPRRHRVRRPLHSRPRPPSAPLAPPVI